MRCGILLVFVLVAGQPLFAQQAVQQPVVGTTGVNTTVSVPDRGTTFIGGVSSAQSGRTQYGPIRPGTSTGLTRQSSSMSVSVRIIDLHEMDEEILNSGPAVNDSRRPATSYTASRTNRYAVSEPVASARRRTSEIPADDGDKPAVEKMAQSEALARKAEAAGKSTLAKLHWQMAAKHGSKAAERRLAEMAKPTAKTTETVAR